VVSAHNFEALDELLAALRSPAVRRSAVVPAAPSAEFSAEPESVVAGPQTQPATFSLPLTTSLGKRWSPGR
jgi:hypothetical protein